MTSISKLIDNKYQLIRKLGSGGFGNVWLAKDILINDRLVAIKSLKKSYSLEKTPLIDEMQYLSSLDHPNIVKFFHHIREHDNLYLVMEYCKGGSLNQFRNNKSLPIDQVFQWGFKIAETLEMVHSKSIIHHDIKPDNLLLTEQGIIKIGDFGIANEDFGTICYLAPEQMLTERNHKLDPRIDVYALGLTLLELIIGKNYFFNIGLSSPLVMYQ